MWWRVKSKGKRWPWQQKIIEGVTICRAVEHNTQIGGTSACFDDPMSGEVKYISLGVGCWYLRLSCQCLWFPILQLPVSVAASTSVASVSGCQYLLPVSQAASISVATAEYFSCQCLCLSCWYLRISCQSLGCLYLNCRCPCLSCRCLLVPWLMSRFCTMVA